jgi:hypothetical protein
VQQSPRPVDHRLNESFDNSIAWGAIWGICEMQHQSTRRRALEFWHIIIVKIDLRHNSRNAMTLWLADFGFTGMTSPSDVPAQSSNTNSLRSCFSTLM